MSIYKTTELEVSPAECLAKRCDVRRMALRKTIEVEELEEQLRRVSKEKELYEEAVVVLMSTIKEMLRPDHAALNLLKGRLAGIPEILALHYFVSDGVINIWIVTKEENLKIEMEIADSLAELFHVFRNLRFDFMIVPKHDLDPQELLPSDSIAVFSR